MKVTKNWIDYQAAPYGKIAQIPAGVPVRPATNLPEGGYWVEAWQGMDEKAESWHRSYGFHVTEEQVAESPYALGQRVRIHPCGGFPAVKTMRYGIVHGVTQCEGMHLVDEKRTNAGGEWAFLVASYASPNAGAMWFSAKGIEPMKRKGK